jgi:hypothetical protein
MALARWTLCERCGQPVRAADLRSLTSVWVHNIMQAVNVADVKRLIAVSAAPLSNNVGDAFQTSAQSDRYQADDEAAAVGTGHGLNGGKRSPHACRYEGGSRHIGNRLNSDGSLDHGLA